jgi:hypothetical protein
VIPPLPSTVFEIVGGLSEMLPPELEP